MKLTEAIQVLTDFSRRGRVLFTRNDLRKLFPNDREPAFAAGLRRLVSGEVLRRVSNGLYLFTITQKRDPYLIEEIAEYLRRACYNYLSLESALSEYGIISQVPLTGITVMTTGREGTFSTPYGQIEFTHTDRSVGNILDNTRDVGRPLLIANPGAAVRDLRRVGRNTHLIDEDELEEVLNDG